MEASTIPATALAPTRAPRVVGPLLRLRSDEQLVRLFRTGNEEAFRVIHDRYRQRLLAYARQMLGGARADAEDALQDVFVRAYAALRANDRDVSLRAWLYRIAHNRCIDELRRPAPPSPETLELLRPPSHDPLAATEQRESLRRLVADVQRLPEQQRSALLMREISGMAYEDLAAALDVTVPSIKSLLVRARVGLAQAAQARDTACVEIREALADAHERGVRASGLAKRHLQDCAGCRDYRKELQESRARFAALVPSLGPVALLAKLVGIGGGGAAGGAGATAAGGGAVAGAGALLGGGSLGIGASHVVAVVAATVVSAGGVVEVQHALATHRHAHHAVAAQVAAPPRTLVTAPLTITHPADAARARGRVLSVSVVVADPAPAPVLADPASPSGGAALPPELVEPATPAVPSSDAPAPSAPATDSDTGDASTPPEPVASTPDPASDPLPSTSADTSVVPAASVAGPGGAAAPIR